MDGLRERAAGATGSRGVLRERCREGRGNGQRRSQPWAPTVPPTVHHTGGAPVAHALVHHSLQQLPWTPPHMPADRPHPCPRLYSGTGAHDFVNVQLLVAVFRTAARTSASLISTWPRSSVALAPPRRRRGRGMHARARTGRRDVTETCVGLCAETVCSASSYPPLDEGSPSRGEPGYVTQVVEVWLSRAAGRRGAQWGCGAGISDEGRPSRALGSLSCCAQTATDVGNRTPARPRHRSGQADGRPFLQITTALSPTRPYDVDPSPPCRCYTAQAPRHIKSKT